MCESSLSVTVYWNVVSVKDSYPQVEVQYQYIRVFFFQSPNTGFVLSVYLCCFYRGGSIRICNNYLKEPKLWIALEFKVNECNKKQ